MSLIEDLDCYHDELAAEGWHNAAKGCADAIDEIERLRHELSEDGVTARRRMHDDIEMLGAENERLKEAEEDAEGRYLAVYQAKCLVDAEIERLRGMLQAFIDDPAMNVGRDVRERVQRALKRTAEG